MHHTDDTEKHMFNQVLCYVILHDPVHLAVIEEDSKRTEVPSYLSESESSWVITLGKQPADHYKVVQGRNVI